MSSDLWYGLPTNTEKEVNPNGYDYSVVDVFRVIGAVTDSGKEQSLQQLW